MRIEEASSRFFEYSLHKNSHKHFKLFGILLLYLGNSVFQRTITILTEVTANPAIIRTGLDRIISANHLLSTE